MGITHMAGFAGDNRKWWIVDAKGKPLGRVASLCASILRGKHKPDYTPSTDSGDGVIVLNAQEVGLTGKKRFQKVFFTHSGYPGGARYTPYDIMLKKHPERVLRAAIWGMLPHNRLGRKIMKHVLIYRGSTHPHEAQKPSVWQGGN